MAKSSVFLAISYTKRMKVENAIRKYLESKGLEVITGRDVTSGCNLCDEIINLIKECDFGVVVYNELRHNISYEWGLLDVLKKNALLLKDENIHIDLDEELSDKKGLAFTPFFGEDTQEEIIEQLKKNKGLEKALENNIEKRISQDKTPDAKKAAELLVKSDLVLGDISTESIKELPNSKKIIQSLEKIKTLTAEGHFIKGKAYSSEKNFPKAIEDYSKAIELNPNNANEYFYRGVAYLRTKKFDEAIEDYKKAIELNPDDNYSYSNLAEVFILNNDYENSLITAQKSLEIAKEIKDIIASKFLIVLSLILQGKGENEEKELIEYCNLNKGVRLTFEFETLKIGTKNSKYSGKINKLIKFIEENAKST